jgi:hypothetical protein
LGEVGMVEGLEFKGVGVQGEGGLVVLGGLGWGLVTLTTMSVRVDRWGVCNRYLGLDYCLTSTV